MRKLKLIRSLILVTTAAAVLAACSEASFLLHTAKRLNSSTSETTAPYKIGKPYKIRGVWYTPQEDWTYDRRGIASWYGPNFDGKPTANGETFDQWGVSAAHKTLPLPTMVRVTNLDNGRSLVVRINDRGPFVGDRVIDMSRRAAQLLGFEKKGTAQVRVQVLAQESKSLAQQAGGTRTALTKANSPIKVESVASQPVTVQELPVQVASLSPPPQTSSSVPLAADVDMYVQAGAFSKKLSAERVKTHLGNIGNVVITPFTNSNEVVLYRVRVGPVYSEVFLDQLFAKVVQAGYLSAITVILP